MSNIRFDIVDEDRHDNELTGATVIKVIGVGGGGSNAVNRMIDSGLTGVQFVVMNTDCQALKASRASRQLTLGREVTKGLGAGGDPSVGEKAAQEQKDDIRHILEKTDMVFITAGMGGGTGTGAAPVIASIAREMGILCVAVVTKPFSLEGRKKMELAETGIQKLREHVDTLITIPNQNLLRVVQKSTPLRQAFMFADDVLRQGVQGISDLITKHGDINIDFADVKTIMKGRGDALMGVGVGTGDARAMDAATNAIQNQLLEDTDIQGAEGILVNVTGGPDFSLAEYEEVLNIVSGNADPDALVIAGTTVDDSLGDEIHVTVIATGFRNKDGHRALPKKEEASLASWHREPPARESHATTRPAPVSSPRGVSNGAEPATFSADHWNNIMNRSPSVVAQDSGAGDDNLEIPTYLRLKSRMREGT